MGKEGNGVGGIGEEEERRVSGGGEGGGKEEREPWDVTIPIYLFEERNFQRIINLNSCYVTEICFFIIFLTKINAVFTLRINHPRNVYTHQMDYLI